MLSIHYDYLLRNIQASCDKRLDSQPSSISDGSGGYHIKDIAERCEFREQFGQCGW